MLDARGGASIDLVRAQQRQVDADRGTHRGLGGVLDAERSGHHVRAGEREPFGDQEAQAHGAARSGEEAQHGRVQGAGAGALGDRRRQCRHGVCSAPCEAGSSSGGFFQVSLTLKFAWAAVLEMITSALADRDSPNSTPISSGA